MTLGYLTEQKVQPSLDEDIDLLAELFLNSLFADPAQVSGALADPTQSQGTSFVSHLFGQLRCSHIDGRPRVQLSSHVASVVQLVIRGIEGESLHHIRTSARKFTMKSFHFLKDGFFRFFCELGSLT